MARRRDTSRQELTALAREAVQEVERADDPEAAAEQVLGRIPDLEVRLLVVELSFTAPDRVSCALVGAALRSGEPELARAAADVLVNVSESPAAVGVLREAFQIPDAGVRRRAVEAVEGFRDPAVLPLLADALGDESDSVQRAAIGTIGLLVGTRTHPLREAVLGELSDPHSALSQAVATSPDVHVRRQALQGLAFADSDQVLPTVEAMCTDEDPEVRQEAALCLAAIGTQTATQMLGAMLSDESHQVASSVLDMLAALLGGASPDFLAYLKRAVKHAQPAVRRHGVLMLNRFDADQVAPVLEEATRDPDFEVARGAAEMLRRYRPDSELGWLADEMAGQRAGERALTVWEAGNIGLETAPAAGKQAEGRTDALVPMLERALREGSPSDKVHAINELAGLVDIADSPAMRAALEDPDPGVCSRAADALQYTRDAGLLKRVGASHQDPLVRRVATEVLLHDPGGPARRGRVGRDIAFTSMRTASPELFGHFLSAIEDPDEGVRQIACGAVRQYAQSTGLLPVRATLRAVERLAEDESVSYLMREDAAHAAEAAGESDVADLVRQAAGEVLAWRGTVAREAHALRWDEGAGAFRLEAGAPERWADALGLSVAEADALQGASSGSQPLDASLGRRVAGGLAKELGAALQAVAGAARGLALIGPAECEAELRQWAAALETGPSLRWGPRGEAAVRRLRRVRRWAWIDVQGALTAFGDEAAADALLQAAADEDDWVGLVALTALAERGGGRDEAQSRMLALCRQSADEQDGRRPIGRAAVQLLRGGRSDAPRLLESALSGPRIDERLALAQRVLVAAQDEAAAGLLEGFLTEKPMDSLPQLCLALALRGAGRDLSALSFPSEAPSEPGSELLSARLGLRAMGNDAEAAQELEAMLREGEPRQRYAAAHYLALGRVRSAVRVFASVADQTDAPYMLRGLCAASLMRRGHAGGVAAMTSLIKAATGRPDAELLLHLCRGVEAAIPLMLQCRDVNVGRFV